MRLQAKLNLAEIGYWISEDMQTLDIVTRSCAALLDLLFINYSVNRGEIPIAAQTQ